MKHKLFSHSNIKNQFFWFRIFGYGLVIKNWKLNGLTFSDRHGFGPHIKIGNYIIRPLKP